jgi:hypothetical protein
LVNLNEQVANVVNVRFWEKNPEAYFRDCLVIRDEHGAMVPLEPNPHQLIVHQAIREQREQGLPVRLIILKPRKTGTSTQCAGEIYHTVRFRPADALVVANDDATTEYLFQITHRFYDNLPTSERLALVASNRKELRFARRPDTGLEGSILVATAGTKTVGRGFTPLYLHCSEVPYFPNSETVMTGLLNSIPDTIESMVILEGTANGMGGWFYDMWQRSKAGLTAYKPVFLSWKDFPKYSMRVAHEDRFTASLSSEERRLQGSHGLTLEQLNWRRWALENKCHGDVQYFRQEYPLTDVEAFITSGRGRFDREILCQMTATEPIRGDLCQEDSYGGGSRITFQPNREGWLAIWRRPQERHNYCIGADVAEGIEIEGAGREDRYDWSVADVFDVGTGEQVAQLRCQIEPDEFGRQLSLLGKWYNAAFLGVEANKNGDTVLNELKHCTYPLSQIYTRTHSTDGGRYSIPQEGWLTTTVTRIHLINDLDRAIRQKSVIINSGQTVSELMSFVRKPDGRVEADAGRKDDCVFSLGIALAVMPSAPNKIEVQSSAPTELQRPTRYQHMNPIYAPSKH